MQRPFNCLWWFAAVVPYAFPFNGFFEKNPLEAAALFSQGYVLLITALLGLGKVLKKPSDQYAHRQLKPLAAEKWSTSK